MSHPTRKPRIPPNPNGAQYANTCRDLSAAPSLSLPRAPPLTVIPNAITEAQEMSLLEELLPTLDARKYEDGHWDGVISN